MDYIINYGMHKQKIIIKTSLMGCFRPLSNEHIGEYDPKKVQRADKIAELEVLVIYKISQKISARPDKAIGRALIFIRIIILSSFSSLKRPMPQKCLILITCKVTICDLHGHDFILRQPTVFFAPDSIKTVINNAENGTNLFARADFHTDTSEIHYSMIPSSLAFSIASAALLTFSFS